MVSALLSLLSSWPIRGLFERLSENEDCLRLRVVGGDEGCSDSGRMTAEATALKVDMISKSIIEQ